VVEKKLMITLDERIRTEFRLNSVKNNTSMNKLVIKLIKEYNEKQRNK